MHYLIKGNDAQFVAEASKGFYMNDLKVLLTTVGGNVLVQREDDRVVKK